MFLLASLLPMLPAYAQSSAPTTITKEELAKQLPQEDAAHLDDILRLLRRNTTLFDLKRVGARKPNELPVTLFAGDGHTKWLNLRDTMTPIAWGDFFTGCLVLPGPETNGTSRSALYNPWWDAILLVWQRQQGEDLAPITDLRFMGGERFRGESVPARPSMDSIMPSSGNLEAVWLRLCAATFRAFNERFCAEPPPPYPRKFNAEDETPLQLRATMRLAMTANLMKNAGARGEMLNFVRLLRKGKAEHFAKVFPGKMDNRFFSVLLKLDAERRGTITCYGYWGKETERLYCFICEANPRLVMMVYVHVGRAPDFELLDLNEADKYLQAMRKK